MSRTPTPTASAWAIILLAVVALGACAEDGLEAASAELEEIEALVEQARARVEESDALASKTGEALERARQELEAAEQQLAGAREHVESQTNDAVLFRSVQQRLLDESDLDDVAITARVKGRIVTLDGSVPSEELKRLAEEIAKQTRGITTVVNQITIDVAARPAE